MPGEVEKAVREKGPEEKGERMLPFLTAGCQVVKLKVTPLCHRLGWSGQVQRPDIQQCHSGG